jgi:hypothetical protein
MNIVKNRQKCFGKPIKRSPLCLACDKETKAKCEMEAKKISLEIEKEQVETESSIKKEDVNKEDVISTQISISLKKFEELTDLIDSLQIQLSELKN